MSEIPEGVSSETIFESGVNKFSSSEYDCLREYVRAAQDADVPFSKIVLNISGSELEDINGVSAPVNKVGVLTISEFIDLEADIHELEESEVSLDEAFESWYAGAMTALKTD